MSPSRIAAAVTGMNGPPPTGHGSHLLYGLAQPVLGARVFLSDRRLLVAGLVPAAFLAAFCAVIAILDADGVADAVRRFYTTFAALAPVPSVLFAHHYARLAVMARRKLGFEPPGEPCYDPLHRRLRRAIKQAILVAIAILPAVGLLELVPLAGDVLVKIAAAAWALHWIVVDAFDSARYLRPGQTMADLDAEAHRLRPPWYVRALLAAARPLPIGKGLVTRFARFCDRLSLSWREEIALIEAHPSLMFGFALSTAALLALPILNLLFRPIVLLGAVRVIGQLDAVQPPPR